jgi:predicted nucleic acid-binding protein
MSGKIYIETTIPSFSHETRKDIESLSRHYWTRKWWDEHRHDYELFTSLAVLQELDSPAYPSAKREKSLHLLRDLPVLGETARIGEIIRACQRHKLMPQSPAGDALHLALASVHGCDFLLTWNCVHLANPNQLDHIRHVNERLGLPMPMLLTPVDLLGTRL